MINELFRKMTLCTNTSDNGLQTEKWDGAMMSMESAMT